MPPVNANWYRFVRWLVRNTFFRGVGGLRAVGRERVPVAGALIVAPVHLSHLDPPAVACACPRRLRFMAKQELFEHRLFGWLIRSLGSFPVRRGEGDTEAIRLTISLLEQGEAVLVFPEGTRGDGQTMLPINKGVTMLARRTGAWVLPAGIVGTHKVLPKGASRPRRSRVTVAFGEPFRFEDAGDKDAFARELEGRILALCREHGLPLRSASSLPAPEASRGAEARA